jgi:hypothetical protein
MQYGSMQSNVNVYVVCYVGWLSCLWCRALNNAALWGSLVKQRTVEGSSVFGGVAYTVWLCVHIPLGPAYAT